MLRTLASRWLAPLILVGLAAAQEIQVPSGPLEVGKTIEFKVSDPSRANGSIVVTIDNGDPVNPVHPAILFPATLPDRVAP